MAEQPKINTKLGPKAYRPPNPERYPAGAEARHLVTYADTLGSAGDLGTAISEISIRALERAEETHKAVAEAMTAVNVEQAAMEKAGHPAARLVQTPEGIRSVGSKFGELADSADPLLAKEQERLDADIRKVAQYQEAILKKIDAAITCPTTQSDAPLRSDIRNHLKSLSPTDARYQAIKAATDGDMATVSVILNSPPHLMGLKAKDVDAVRLEARKRTSPALWAAYEKSDVVLKHMTTGSKAIGKKKDSINGYRLADQQASNDALGKLKGMARA